MRRHTLNHLIDKLLIVAFGRKLNQLAKRVFSAAAHQFFIHKLHRRYARR